jgi:hypothetical protein
MTVGLVLILGFLIWYVPRWRRKRREAKRRVSASNLPPHDVDRIRKGVIRLHAEKQMEARRMEMGRGGAGQGRGAGRRHGVNDEVGQRMEEEGVGVGMSGG